MKKLITATLIAIMLGSMLVFAQDTLTAHPAKEYGWGARTIDQIKLIFTLKEEKKLDLLQKIQEKREQHYQFLINKGKTEQAEKFQLGTTALTSKIQVQIQKTQARADELTAKLKEVNKTE